jgi:TolB-like protein/DNA-binding winged helix-turn-helix (wHTH) protein
MGVTKPTASAFQFGVFELDLKAGELRKQGIKVKLQEQPFQVLATLLEHAGEVVTKDELQQQIWAADTFVDFDHGLHSAITRLREALGDSSESPRFIETIPRRGYRFVAPLKLIGSATESGVAEGKDRLWTFGGSVLAGLLGGALLLGAVLTLNLGGARRWLWRESNPAIRSLAVLPLENLSGDPAEDYFADGMTDALIADLSKISALRVISRTSAMQYKGTKKRLPQIARELNVDGVVEGSVMRSGNRVRITAQLLQAGTDQHLWAETYERDLGDVLKLQGEVAQTIAQQIRIQLTPQQKAQFGSALGVSPEAYEAYLRGRYFWNQRTEEGLGKSVGLFRHAIDIDPNFPLPYTGLADSYLLLGDFGFLAPDEAYPKAKAEALKALRLDDHLAEGHAALAMVALEYDWDWVNAEREFRFAIEANPNYATGHQWYAEYLTTLGRSEEAINRVNLSQELDPVSLPIIASGGLWLYYAQRYDAAIEQSRKAIEMNRNFWMPHWVLGRVYNRQRLYEKAISELQIASTLPGPHTFVLSELGYAYARSGRTAEARKIAQTLKKEARPHHYSGLELARIYVGLGEQDQALTTLEKGCDQRSMYLIWLRVEPTLQVLHTDPRFQDLLSRVGLSP